MNEYRKFDLADVGNTTLTDGFFGKRLDNYMEIIDSMLDALLCPTNSARLLNFGILAGEVDDRFFGSNWSDGDCYKFLEGCCYIYQNKKDEKVKAVLDKYIPWIVKSQEPDGYLSTQVTLQREKDEWGDAEQHTIYNLGHDVTKGTMRRWAKPGHHELYNMGHLFTFAVAHFQATGEDTMIIVARKLADYLCTVFEGYPVEMAHFGVNPSQIMGLCELYKVTKEERYYRLAEIFVNMRGSQPGGGEHNQDKTPLREETIATGHAVMSVYLYSGAAEVYAQTGEEALMVALERIWKDMTSMRSYITGASSPIFVGHTEGVEELHEAHGIRYELPNKIAYNETCANIGNAMWAMRMLSLTENTEYGDFAETVMYNSGISGTDLSLTRFFYSNPLSYRVDNPIPQTARQYKHKSSRRWHTFTCWCCPPQIFRAIAGMGKFVYGVNNDTLYLNFFTSCDYNDDNFSVKMTTNYPWEEDIKIVVEKADNKKMKIRIPAWCKNPTVNGTAVNAGYYEIAVNTGDEITVNLPMPAVLMQANPQIEQDRGMVCIKRGPVVYCAEGVDNDKKLDDIYLDVDSEITAEFKPELLNGVVTLTTKAKTKKEQNTLYYELLRETENTTLNLVPYYTWANREECDMSIWFPKL
ncbi:MAG: glycoside hydrolase family 127 protein [Clostridia bacterium]